MQSGRHLVGGVGDEPVPDVGPHVLAQQAGLQEAPGADAAGVRLVGHVGLPVHSQGGRAAEDLRAYRAAVRLLRVVDLGVLQESRHPREAPPTAEAAVGGASLRSIGAPV